jgi:NadR type nicotinamide-nucleotide adenylyltransferase
VKRVVLIGSESTGKTTLAQHLAGHYHVSWVPEFVREYGDRKGEALDFADHGPIARGQIALEDDHRRRASDRDEQLLIQDTDLLSTAVYCAHYYGHCPRWIQDAARERRPDLYLLLDIDLPWVPDPQRDRGDRRAEMQGLFRDAVSGSGSPFVEISGDETHRLETARAAIDRLLSESP